MSLDNKPKFDKPEDLIWDTYLNAAHGEDEARPRSWEGSTTGILTFTGLFAATVAAFIIESYKKLSPDSGDRTNALLEHLIVAMANVSSHNPVSSPPAESFSVDSTAIVANVFWFTSLLIALVCALLSTLVQEWSRNYVQDIHGRQAGPHENLRTRAFNHIFIRMGVDRYKMDQFVSWIVTLMHLSVFLFACGLLVFLFPINHIVASVAAGVISMFIVIYFIGSLLPLVDPSCPYRTPLSYMMALVYWATLRGLSACMRLWPRRKRAHGHFDLLRLVARHYTGYHWEFMTDSRFIFAWEHTYLHITDESLKTFLMALPSVLNRPSIWSRLCSDLVFMRRLWLYLDGLHRASRADPSSLLVEDEIFELVACLSERMYAVEVEQHGKHIEEAAYTSAYCLDVLGSISQLTEIDGPSQLSALLCLAHARWSLLKRCQEAFTHKMPIINAGGVPNFFREASRTGFRLEGNRHSSPCGVLLLLISGSYTNRSWEHKSTSCLVPLHEGDCCRSWTSILTPKGLAHVAACNALSVIAYLLHASEEQRRNAKRVKVNIHKIAEKWDASFSMDEISRGAPSREFIAILHAAGLQEWTEPDSKFLTGPAEGPNRRFLTNTYQGKCCVRALQNLARKVDFAAYRSRAAPRFPTPLIIPSSSSVGVRSTFAPITPPHSGLNVSPYNVFPLPDGSIGRYAVQQDSPTRMVTGVVTPQRPTSNSAHGNEEVFLVDAVRQPYHEGVGSGGEPNDHSNASGSSQSKIIQRSSRRLGTVYTRYDAEVTHDGLQPRSPYANEEMELDTLVPLLAGAANSHGGQAEWGDGHGSPRLMTVAVIDDRLHVGAMSGDVVAAATDSVLQRGWGEYRAPGTK